MDKKCQGYAPPPPTASYAPVWACTDSGLLWQYIGLGSRTQGPVNIYLTVHTMPVTLAERWGLGARGRSLGVSDFDASPASASGVWHKAITL